MLIVVVSRMQVVNYSHLFPTRYALELEGLKGSVGSETFKEVSQREDSKKQIKKLLEDRYTSGKNKWFFQPLRVRTLFSCLTPTSPLPPKPRSMPPTRCRLTDLTFAFFLHVLTPLPSSSDLSGVPLSPCCAAAVRKTATCTSHVHA